MLGIVASSGGAAFDEIARITGQRFFVITDRACGAEKVARRHGFEALRIEEKDRVSFSKKAADALAAQGCTGALLFFHRLVTEDLFGRLPVHNIHPAALPLFPGLHGVEDAYAARSYFLGCTLHQVDASMDGGPVTAQVVRAVNPEWSIERWQKIAFLMKVYCGLVWCAREQSPCDYVPTGCVAGIPSSWGHRYDELQRSEQEFGAGSVGHTFAERTP